MLINKNIEKNFEYIKNTYNNSCDIVTRIIKKRGKKVGYIYLESVSSDNKISNFLNKSLIKNITISSLLKNLENNIYNSHITSCHKFSDIFYFLASGYTALFIDNEDSCIVIETKTTLDRGITESSSEPIIRGPKDSFTENHAVNLGLIRKRIKDPNLIFNEIKIGKRTKTKVSVAYINDIADINKVNDIINNLKKINIDGILDSGYVREFLNLNKSLFPQTISTERPDLTCTSLLDGKIVILVENTPYVLIIPGLFVDFIHSPEDNYQKPSNASFNRILRILCFFITMLTPAIYIALMTFNPEIIPDQLLISLAIQREGVPFPTAIEVLIFIITFEILRQADVHSPTVSGSAMNIVGALILGDAAVNAGVVSPIAIIVIAVTCISELVFYDVDMINALRQWRIIFIFATLFVGIIGLVASLFVFVAKLSSLNSFQISYLNPISPLSITGIKNYFIRIKRTKLQNRVDYLSKNSKRMINYEENINNN